MDQNICLELSYLGLFILKVKVVCDVDDTLCFRSLVPILFDPMSSSHSSEKAGQQTGASLCCIILYYYSIMSKCSPESPEGCRSRWRESH